MIADRLEKSHRITTLMIEFMKETESSMLPEEAIEVVEVATEVAEEATSRTEMTTIKVAKKRALVTMRKKGKITGAVIAEVEEATEAVEVEDHMSPTNTDLKQQL
jgi:uncharacterized protein YqgV (UPF0045/DUF77 family)